MLRSSVTNPNSRIRARPADRRRRRSRAARSAQPWKQTQCRRSAVAINQRLHAQAVANQGQRLARLVPDSEWRTCRAGAEPGVDAPLPGSRAETSVSYGERKRWPSAFQLRANFLEVVNAAVEDEPDLAVVGEHGLIAGRAEIQNRQPPVAEGRARPVGNAFGIRTAALQSAGHAAHRVLGVFWIAGCDHPRYSTHSWLPAHPIDGYNRFVVTRLQRTGGVVTRSMATQLLDTVVE